MILSNIFMYILIFNCNSFESSFYNGEEHCVPGIIMIKIALRCDLKSCPFFLPWRNLVEQLSNLAMKILK